MCDPVTLAIAATAVATVGTGFSALQASAQNRYQGKIADRNADLANEAARQEIDNTRTEALAHYRKQAELKGQQRVALAAGGVDVNFGSAADLAADTELLGNEDVNRLYQQGNERTRGFEIEASNYTAEAGARRQAATGNIIGGVFDMGRTALGGAQQYSRLKAKGY